MGWVPDYADAHDYTVPFYANSSNGGLFAVDENYNNPYVNELLMNASTASPSTTRSNLYAQMEHNATSDFPYIYLTQAESVFITRSWIHGLSNATTNSLSSMQSYPNYQWLTKYETQQQR